MAILYRDKGADRRVLNALSTQSQRLMSLSSLLDKRLNLAKTEDDDRSLVGDGLNLELFDEYEISVHTEDDDRSLVEKRLNLAASVHCADADPTLVLPREISS